MLHALVDAAQLLDDPVAQRLLQSPRQARVAWTSRDGASINVPVVFHWNGRSLVVGVPPGDQVFQSLDIAARVTVTIDSAEMPNKALVLGGWVRTDVVEGIAPEYEAAVLRCLGEEEGRAWLDRMRPRCRQMARVFVESDRYRILEFRMRFPGPSEQAVGRNGRDGTP